MEKAKQANPIGFYEPLPSAKLFHASEALKRLDTGGNRSSKTYSGGAESVFWLDGHSPYREIPKGPLTGVISGLSFPLMEHSLLPILQELAPPSKFEIRWSRDERWIRGPNGTAWFKSNEQGWQSYQSRALDFFWLDEEHDWAVYRQLCKRLKRGAILQSWYTMTAEPDKPFHWTYSELAKPALDQSSDIEHFKFDLNDNRISRGGHLLDSEVDRMIRETPEDDRPAVIHGEYPRPGGLIYKMWNEKHHLAEHKELRWHLDQVRQGFLTAYCWLDWGVRNPTAIGLVVEGPDGDIELIDEIYHPAKDGTVGIKKEFGKRFAMFKPVKVIADPSLWHKHESADPQQTIGGKLMLDDPERGLRGLLLEAGDNDWFSGQAAVADLLEVDPIIGPKFKVQPRCAKFREEIANYTGLDWATGGELKNKKEAAKQKDDHHMDGFRYFALSAHGYIPPRWQRRKVRRRVNRVTGYMRPVG